MISPRDLDNYRTQASDAVEIDDDSASATGAWSSSKFAAELAKLTDEFSLVTNYQNFTEVTGLPTSANPVVALPRGSLPEGRALGYWMTVKKHSKLMAVQTIDYGPDTASIPVSNSFARWTGYIDYTTNGTPGYGTSSTSNTGGYGSMNGKGAFDGVYADNYNHTWDASAGRYSTSTGAYVHTVSTSVIANYGGVGFTAQPVLGEWIQFQFPYDVIINELRPYAKWSSEFVFAGSMDGVQWSQLAVGTGSQNHWNGSSNLASYSFNGTRVRYVRFIITNSSNFEGVPHPQGKASVNELEMYVTTRPSGEASVNELEMIPFARWTGYITHETNGTPGYGTSSVSSYYIGYGSFNGKGAFDGVFSNHYNNNWLSSQNRYDISTGAYVHTPSTTTNVIANYGGLGYTAQPVLGEWVQFKFPYDVVINELRPYAQYTKEFTFAGSMDGLQWYLLTNGGAQNHFVPPPNLASYSFNGTRVRYVRFIITNASNFTGGTDPLGRAVVNELEMIVSAPFRRRHLHEIHRLDYVDPTFGNVALRPSETDRVAALDPANSASVSLSLVKSFHTEELSRAGNVVTHREVDVVTGAPLDFSDPVYTLPPGYYYIVTKLPAYDSAGEVVREGGWAISLAADTIRKHVGVDHSGVKSLFSGDTAGGQVSTPGLKTALAMGSTTQLGPIVYPYVLANYRFQRVKPPPPPPPVTSFALTPANSGSTVSISAGAPLTFTDSGGAENSYQNSENYWVIFDCGSSAGATVLFSPDFSFEHSEGYAYDRLGVQSSSDGITFNNISTPWLQTSSTSSAPWSIAFGGSHWNSAASKNGWIVPRDSARATSLGWDNGPFTVPARYIRFWFTSDSGTRAPGWVAVLTRL